MNISEQYLPAYLRNSEKVIHAYSYNQPFARFLKNYFKENPKMGSRDRKIVSRYCYNYFRIGDFAEEHTFTDRVILAEYLCEKESVLVEKYSPELYSTIEKPISEKINILNRDSTYSFESVFPVDLKFSEEIDKKKFLEKQLVQPNLYLRAKQTKVGEIQMFFDKHSIAYSFKEPNTFVLDNRTSISHFRGMKGNWEVQDLSSQQTFSFFPKLSNNEVWWDACAGSGGKSLMLLDAYPNLKLYLSDSRSSILKNLRKRFSEAGISADFHTHTLDLNKGVSFPENVTFDGLLLDVPCSGSGTWSRTPEMKLQFKKEDIYEYTTLQKNIVKNALPHLKKGGCLMYVTCSIFNAENESIADYICTEFNMSLDRKELIKGYENKADTMFVARFYK